MSKKTILAGLTLLAVSVSGLSYASAPHSAVHANPTLWFISWMDKDTGYTGLPYSYTFSWADTQTSTITITSDWGDGMTDSTTSTGKCCDPPTAYSASPTIGHVYVKSGVYIHTTTLSDSFGNSVTKNTVVTISPVDPSNQVYVGGLGGKPLVPT